MYTIQWHQSWKVSGNGAAKNIGNLTQKVTDCYNATKGITPKKVEFTGSACETAGIKIEFLNDSICEYKVDPMKYTNQLIFKTMTTETFGIIKSKGMDKSVFKSAETIS